jgi:hypothetical protein
MQVGFERLIGSLLPPRQRPLRALIAKELHFQYNTLILFLVLALLQVLAILYVKLAHPRDPDLYFLTPFFIYAPFMPLIIGSSAIAEERNLGARAWHLTIPVSARLQWFIKLSVVLLFAALFGIGVPLFWLLFYVPASELPPLFALTLFCTSVFLVTLISFYASSFARDTVRALLTAAGLVIALVFAGSWLTFSVERIPVMVRAWFPYLNNVVISSVLLNKWILLGFPLLAFAILLLLGSLKHFRTLDHSRSRLWSSVLLVFLPPLFLLFLPLNIAVAVNNPSFRVTSTHPATSRDTSALHPSRSDQNR